MYPRNAASPPRIGIGAVVQISDGAVQSSGVSIVVQPEGGSETAGGGTVSYGASSGAVYYTPTQAETNYTAFVLTAYKTGCIPVSQTIVTSANAVSGIVRAVDSSGNAIAPASDLTLVLADTNELQTDWVNGGRLDLILDARASETNATVNKAAILSVVADVHTDVNTILTRIPAALFAGITSLAQWLGLIAGKQTGNSTARTELRATGAGSGTFDETTDSQEALRDRGDVAWISGAGASAADIAAALASQPIVIQSPTTTNGTLDLVQGMDYYTADGREIEFTFARDYVPSSCKLTIAAGAVVTVTSTDISESSGSGSGRFHVRFELPRTTGDDLEAGTGTFEVISVVGSHEVGEVAEGVATIRRRLTA